MFESIRHNGLADKSPSLFSAPKATSRRSQSWLDAQLARMRKQGAFVIFAHTVTPDAAELLLTLNTSNRRVRRARVSRLARAITEGRWLNTGHPVCVSSDGVLIDGQHRLMAIVEAGRAAILSVAFGVDPEAFKVIDTHGVRNTSDALHVIGESHSALLAASLRLLFCIENGMPRHNLSVDNDILVDYLERHSGLRRSCTVGHMVAQNLKCAPTPMAVAHYLIAQAPQQNAEAVELFFDGVASGLGLTSRRDPIYVLRRFITESDWKGTHGWRASLTAATIIAWNAFKAGKKVNTVQWKDGTPFPEAQ